MCVYKSKCNIAFKWFIIRLACNDGEAKGKSNIHTTKQPQGEHIINVMVWKALHSCLTLSQFYLSSYYYFNNITCSKRWIKKFIWASFSLSKWGWSKW